MNQVITQERTLTKEMGDLALLCLDEIERAVVLLQTSKRRIKDLHQLEVAEGNSLDVITTLFDEVGFVTKKVNDLAVNVECVVMDEYDFYGKE